MLFRLEEEPKYVNMPESWSEKVQSSIKEVFKAELIRESKEVEVFGFITKKEFTLCVSLINPSDEFSAPFTCLVSLNAENENFDTKDLNLAIDYSGLILEQFLMGSNDLEFFQRWTKDNYKNKEIHYMITRENVKLFIQANELLNKA